MLLTFRPFVVAAIVFIATVPASAIKRSRYQGVRGLQETNTDVLPKPPPGPFPPPPPHKHPDPAAKKKKSPPPKKVKGYPPHLGPPPPKGLPPHGGPPDAPFSEQGDADVFSTEEDATEAPTAEVTSPSAGSTGNGADAPSTGAALWQKCTEDSDCESGRCDHGDQCVPQLDLGKGCDEDSDCNSGKCARKFLIGPKVCKPS